MLLCLHHKSDRFEHHDKDTNMPHSHDNKDTGDHIRFDMDKLDDDNLRTNLDELETDFAVYDAFGRKLDRTAILAIQQRIQKQLQKELRALEPGPKRKGRPPLAEVAMSASERARRYRSRLAEQATIVTDAPEAAEVAVLMAGLQKRLRTISDGSVGEEVRDTARWHAARLVRELVRRHGLEL